MFRISVASKFIDTSVESSIFYIQVITLIILILTKDDDIYFNQKVKQEERYFKTFELRLVETNTRNFYGISGRTRKVSATCNKRKAREVTIL